MERPAPALYNRLAVALIPILLLSNMPKLVTKEVSLDASPVRTQGEGFSKRAITMVISNDKRTVVPQIKPLSSWSIARRAAAAHADAHCRRRSPRLAYSVGSNW